MWALEKRLVISYRDQLHVGEWENSLIKNHNILDRISTLCVANYRPYQVTHKQNKKVSLIVKIE